jgi:hypothetical protein
MFPACTGALAPRTAVTLEQNVNEDNEANFCRFFLETLRDRDSQDATLYVSAGPPGPSGPSLRRDQNRERMCVRLELAVPIWRRPRSRARVRPSALSHAHISGGCWGETLGKGARDRAPSGARARLPCLAPPTERTANMGNLTQEQLAALIANVVSQVMQGQSASSKPASAAK